jgi:hypothetical protein
MKDGLLWRPDVLYLVVCSQKMPGSQDVMQAGLGRTMYLSELSASSLVRKMINMTQ